MSDSVKIHDGEIKLVAIDKLEPRPNNRNIHPPEQIDRLVEIYKYQGFRNPIIVSRQSKQIVCGTGRYLAAKKAGLKKVPVLYQDYETPELEYAHHVADNSLGSWAELDLAGINLDLPELGPDFEIDMLGIKNFVLDMSERGSIAIDGEWKGMPEFVQEDKTALRSVLVNFKTEEDVQQFATLIGQNLTDKTRSIWYPKAEIERLMDKRYIGES